MSAVAMSPLLRRAVVADALLSAVAGLLMTFGAGLLAELLSLPTTLLLAAGATLFPWAGYLMWMARKPAVSSAAVWTVIGINAAWIAASAWVSLGGVFAPNVLGHAFVAAQALGVLALLELEFAGLRRSNFAPA